MQPGILCGRERLELEVRADRLVAGHRAPAAPPLADPAAAVRDALENPLGYPALRRALTPDDHVVVVVEESLPHFAELLAPILEHVTGASVTPETVTVLRPYASGEPTWRGRLPGVWQGVGVEVHDPADRRRLSYLATTKQGRRVYLNRTAVDADQVVVLAGRGYDPLLGEVGPEGMIYPMLADDAARQELAGRSAEAPRRKEAAEVAWLLGAPFLVQVIEGAGEDVAHVVAGPVDSCAEGRRLREERWRVSVDRPAGTVVAGLSGDPARHDFGDLARALACASRLVEPGGRIVLLTQATPLLGPAADLLRQADDPQQAFNLLRKHRPADLAAGLLWAGAAQQAKIYLLGGLTPDAAEEMFATPLEDASQVQRLLGGDGPVLFLDDAHKVLAAVTPSG